jgi:hypothetical protein
VPSPPAPIRPSNPGLVAAASLFLVVALGICLRIVLSLVHRGSRDTSTATTKIPYDRPRLCQLNQRITLSFAAARAELDLLCISITAPTRRLDFCLLPHNPICQRTGIVTQNCAGARGRRPVLSRRFFPSSAALLCERPARRYPPLLVLPTISRPNFDPLTTTNPGLSLQSQTTQSASSSSSLPPPFVRSILQTQPVYTHSIRNPAPPPALWRNSYEPRSSAPPSKSHPGTRGTPQRDGRHMKGLPRLATAMLTFASQVL